MDSGQGSRGRERAQRNLEKEGRLLVCAALQCFCDDEANCVQTATNWGQDCKVRCNNEENHKVFLKGHCIGDEI